MPSSNPDNIDNILYGEGSSLVTWSPADDDPEKTLDIILPALNGVPAGEYHIADVNITSTGSMGPVTVQIYDGEWTPLFEVSHVETFF